MVMGQRCWAVKGSFGASAFDSKHIESCIYCAVGGNGGGDAWRNLEKHGRRKEITVRITLPDQEELSCNLLA